jgi:FKBP-type peptidyl-prolyl cis-trans isomerase SlyD
MLVEKNQKVTFSYSLWDSEGILLENANENPPITYLHGYGHIVPGLEEKLEGRKINEEFTTEVDSKKAFGEYRPELVISVPLKDLMDIPELKVGMEIEIFQEQIDLAKPREKKDMFWTPSSPEDLFSNDGDEMESDEDDETEEIEIYIIKEIRSDLVILDGNAPLAGKNLKFEIKIIDIEPASFEEIEEQYLNDDSEDLF